MALLLLGCDRPATGQTAPRESAVASAAPAPSTLPLPQPSSSGSAPAADAGLDECREQPPQDFLLRQNYIVKAGDAAEQARRLVAREYAVRYRTERYGRFPGFGSVEQNAHPPRHYAFETTFMGHSVTLNRRVIPALACVERAIRRECAHESYRPHRVVGLRDHNTYKDYEISNHVYGIAVDIDPDTNTCCGCVRPWNQHPLCRDKSLSVQQRMAMPECWVRQFERYGFYWLGHDELEDTMHFEFLGDPDRIAG